MLPKVSIIVPVFNVEEYLPLCMESLINQTLTDIEIICVNDDSTDNSLKILEEYAEQDKRIKIIQHEQNAGLGAARNTGIKHTKANYIGFIDSDDYVDNRMFEIMLQEIEANNSDMSWCDSFRFQHEDDIDELSNLPTGNYTSLEVLQNPKLYPSILGVWNKLYRKELIKNIRFPDGFSEDQKFNAEFFLKAKRITVISKTYYFYRVREGSITQPKLFGEKDWNDFIGAHNAFFNTLSSKYSPEILRVQIALRVFSIFWRIDHYRTIQANNKAEQFLIIRKQINKADSFVKLNKVAFFLLNLLTSSKLPVFVETTFVRFSMKLTRRALVKKSYKLALIKETVSFIKQQFKVRLKAFFDFSEIAVIKLMAQLVRPFFKRRIWLLSERTNTAQDNSSYLFRYIDEKQKHENAYYIIDKKSKERLYLEMYQDKLINYNSIKHKILFYASKFYCTSYSHECYPVTFLSKKKYKLKKNIINVFLPHGVTYADNSHAYKKSKALFDLIICSGSVEEYNFFMTSFGYNQNELSNTGFPRFDGLHDFKTNKTIMFAPSWRRKLYQSTEDEFKRSKYFEGVNRLLCNKKLDKLLEDNNYKLVFFPHRLMLSYLHLFPINSRNIIIPSIEEKVQDLLKNASLLITDFSSIHFDYAYMYKPIIYYFWDYDSALKEHYAKGYYNHRTMGFGEVFESAEDIVLQIEHYLNAQFSLEAKFKDRTNSFFSIHDNNNCERAYKSIINYKKTT